MNEIAQIFIFQVRATSEVELGKKEENEKVQFRGRSGSEFFVVGRGTELLNFLVNGKRKAKLESARDFFFLELSE